MRDYTDIKLNKHLLSVNSLRERSGSVVKGVDFDTKYDIQSSEANISKIKSNLFIDLSSPGTISGNVGAGTHVHITSNLLPDKLPKKRFRNFAICFASVYEAGSVVGSMQIFPNFGAGIAADKFRITAGYDEAPIGTVGTSSRYVIRVHNTTGTTASLFAKTIWKFSDHGVSGTQSLTLV